MLAVLFKVPVTPPAGGEHREVLEVVGARIAIARIVGVSLSSPRSMCGWSRLEIRLKLLPRTALLTVVAPVTMTASP